MCRGFSVIRRLEDGQRGSRPTPGARRAGRSWDTRSWRWCTAGRQERFGLVTLVSVVPSACPVGYCRALPVATPPSRYATHVADNAKHGLPCQPTATGMLLRAPDRRLLLVKPTYLSHWEIPSGVVAAGETPWEAAVRETREKLGLARTPPQAAMRRLHTSRPGRAGRSTPDLRRGDPRPG